MKRSVLLKLGLLMGLTAGASAGAQVFNVEAIDTYNFYFYGGGAYNTMAVGQGALSDPGNNVWNGFGNSGNPGSTASFGTGRPNDAVLYNNPGNPYAFTLDGYFADGDQLFSPQDFSSYSAGNATSAGNLSPITVPYMNFPYFTFDTAGLNPNGTTRSNVPLTLFAASVLVNTAAPGVGTAANPEGVMILSNVPPGTYDLFLYGVNPGATRGATFAVDSGKPIYGVTNTMNPNATPGLLTNFTLGVDYTVFNYVTPNADSTIHISWGAISNIFSGLSGEGDFNGLQLAPSTPAPAFIVEPPSNPAFSQGTPWSLQALARGNPGVSVQWYKGSAPGTPLPGQTNYTLSFPAMTTSEVGNYYCVATNSLGSATSSVSSVAIITAPGIGAVTLTTDTNSISLYSGHNHFGMTVGAYADNTHPLTYYWEDNGTPLAVTTVTPTNGIGSGSFVWTNVTGSGIYSCVVSNIYGTATTATTNDISVTIVPAPANPYTAAMLALNPYAYWPMNETTLGATYDYVGGINGQPSATADYQVGQPGPVNGFGSSSLGYYFDGTGNSEVVVPSAYVNFTGPMTIITWVMAQQTGGFDTVAGKGDNSYRIDVDDADQPGLAHFSDDGPSDTSGGPIVNLGEWHQIVGTYDGLTDRLYVDGNLVASTLNANTLTGDGNNFTIGGAPDYGTRNILGSIAQVALLTNALSAAQVEALFKAGETPLFISAEPTSTAGYVGGEATFSVTATGGDPVTYQWFGPGGLIAGATNATLVLTDLSENTSANGGPGSYYATIVNPYSTTNTLEDGSVALTVSSGPPAFIQDLPPTFYALAGTKVVLPVVEAGNPPITNKWFYSPTANPPTTPLNNGGRISGATTTNLVIADVQTNDAGYYQVIASDNVPPYVADSQVAQLIVESTLGFNNDGSQWASNGLANITGNILTITAGTGDEANSEFFENPLYVGAFEASFTYTGGSGADGTTFTIQNSAAGAAAVGADGGSLGYAGITNSIALAFDLYTANPGGIDFVTNGFNPSSGTYTKVTPISFISGDPINVTLNYNGQTLAVNLVDTVTAGTFSTNINFGPIAKIVGTNVAFVGFTGGTGDVISTQTIGNFSYIPLPLLTATHTGTNVVVTWPSAVGGYTLQESSSLTNPTWTSIPSPYATSGANNVATVPATGTSQFFRLVVTP